MTHSSPEIDSAFFEALSGEDDLGVVIRAHIYIEASLIDFINKRITDLKSLRKLRYSQRVDLACDLGLTSEVKKPLKLLGEIRNDFAHKIDAGLSIEKVNEFFNAFDESTKKLFQEAYRASNSSMLRDIPNFSKLSSKDKFIVMVTCLKARLIAELLDSSTI